MPEIIVEEQKNWLQLYVDAMTEKDPYKRLALVRRLRQVPRHDESDETAERPRLRLMAKPSLPKPSLPRLAAPAPKAAALRPHAMRSRKVKPPSKPQRRSARRLSA